MKHKIIIEADETSARIKDSDLDDIQIIEILNGVLMGLSGAVYKNHNCGDWNCHIRMMAGAISKSLKEIEDEHKHLDEQNKS